jgi:hypothetical protein
MICPWPADVAQPRSSTADESGETGRLHQGFFELRRRFARLGVPVVCAAEQDSIALIIKRLEHLRGLERGVR